MYITKNTIAKSKLIKLKSFRFNDSKWGDIALDFHCMPFEPRDFIFLDVETNKFKLDKVRLYVKMSKKFTCRNEMKLKKVLRNVSLTVFAKIITCSGITAEDSEELRCYLVDTMKEYAHELPMLESPSTEEDAESTSLHSTPEKEKSAIPSNWTPPKPDDMLPTTLKHYEQLVATGTRLLNEYKQAAVNISKEFVQYPGYENFIQFEYSCTLMSIAQLEPIIEGHRAILQRITSIRQSMNHAVLLTGQPN